MASLGKMALDSQRKIFNGQDSLDEANKLLVENVDEDYDILLQLGLSNADLDSKLESLGEYKRLTEYSEEYGYCVSREVLEDIAYKYGLKLAKSRYYKYSVPTTITAEIKEWVKLTNVKISDSDDFYILAPSEAFYTLLEYDRFKNAKKGKLPNTKNDDPMLVYEIAGSSREGNGVYSLITEWGSDLNTLRKIKAYIYNKAATFTTLALISIIAAITGIVYMVVNTMTSGLEGNDWVTIILSLFTFIGSSVVIYRLLEEIDPSNINKKNFDFKEIKRNFNIPIITDYNILGEKYFSKFFADIYFRFVIVSAIWSIFFLLFFILHRGADYSSFAKDLGYSNWYFTIPLGLTIVTVIIGFFTRVWKNLFD